MGKYMKKSKLTGGEIALMESTTIGVRTRAKTLALQRATKTPSFHGSGALDASSFSYLQLRSRRLEKCLPPIPAKKKECRNPKGSSEGDEKKEKMKSGGSAEVELSFEENNLDFEARDSRGTRESTPCSFTRDPDSIGSTASITRRTSSAATDKTNQDEVQRGVTPTMQEIEEFFSSIEQDQRPFIEKYNFDFVNDVPLSGHYEWVQITP